MDTHISNMFLLHELCEATRLYVKKQSKLEYDMQSYEQKLTLKSSDFTVRKACYIVYTRTVCLSVT